MPLWAANLQGAVLVILGVLTFFALAGSVIMTWLGNAFGGNSGPDAVATRVMQVLAVLGVVSLFYLIYHPTFLYDVLRAIPRPPAVEITR